MAKVTGGSQAAGRDRQEENRLACILHAIATARGWMRDLTGGRIDGIDAIAAREAITERSIRMTLSLAPRIVEALVDGRLPLGIGIRDLADLPAFRTEQERALGIV